MLEHGPRALPRARDRPRPRFSRQRCRIGTARDEHGPPLQIGPERGTRTMTTTSPKTIFVTGATGLVGSHAVEEALAPRPSRPRAGPRLERHPTGSTAGGSRRSSATWPTPRPSAGGWPGPTGSSTARPRSATGGPWRSSASSTSRPSASCSTPPRTPGSSGSSTSARSGSTRPATTTGPTRRPPRRPTRSTPTPARRPRPRSWPCATSRSGACRWPSSGPASSTARATGRSCPSWSTPSARGRFVYFGSGEQVLNCIYVKNLVHGIFLAAEVPEAVGEVFNLTDGRPRHQAAIRREGGRAGRAASRRAGRSRSGWPGRWRS